MLTIIHALEEWHHIKIWMGHKNLEYFQTVKKLNCCQACWSFYLLCFDFELHHHPGTAMGKSDALSHCLDHGSGPEDNNNVTLLHPELFIVHALEGLTLAGKECGIIQDVKKAFREGLLEDEVAGVVWKLRELGGKSLVSAEWAETNGLLMLQGKVYIPDVHDLRWWIMAQHYDSWVMGHPGRWKTLELVS